MKLNPTLDPKPHLTYGHSIEVRFLSPTNHRPARLKAVIFNYEGREQSITAPCDYGDTTKTIESLVVKLIEKYDLNYLKNSIGKMILCSTKKGWIVCLPV